LGCALALKVYGADLNVLQEKALQIKGALEKVPGFTELTVVRELGQPSLIVDVDREKIARYGVNVSDVEAVVQAAVGGQAAVRKAVALPQGYRMEWGGEYSEFLEAKSQLNVIGPVTVLLIFLILFALYGNFKFPVTIALGVVMTEPVGALVALKLTNTPFSVSSVLGLLALMGVSVETAVILVSYINKLRLEGRSIREATLEASLLRLRPIMMTALVACLGLLPAALSHGIGSDTQRPFAIVIVAGLLSRLLLGFFVNPVLYEMVAREGDVLQV